MIQKIIGYIFLLILLLLTIKIIISGGFIFMHYVDLVLHEAGHVIFTPLGELMHFLGGTIMQLLVPFIFVLYFLRSEDYFAAAIILWWLGESFYDVSVYVADAQAQTLPLLGNGTHDWNHLLTEFGILQHYHVISMIFYGIGAFLMLGSVLWGLTSIHSKKREFRLQ